MDTDLRRLSCACGVVCPVSDGIVEYSNPQKLCGLAEIGARDRQASGYLAHAKFPTQLSRMNAFLSGLPPRIRDRPAIDLGCGPGPYTGLLLRAGFDTMAVDFSRRSLRLNRAGIAENASQACFVEADLNDLNMARGFASVLLMCDFLQHLDGHRVREAFVKKAFSWLAPGGYFFMSFFNLNLVNYFKSDLRGSFSNGEIPYERLICDDVIAMLPSNAVVEDVIPLNIFHAAGLDRVAARLPGARYLARMTAVLGRCVD
jgi:2-polyprenyl-3-methyl-5-hydroxy-6-metoxy-1,4-benzoquinol methylase